MRAYGFEEVVVTRRSRDGGIDGHGRPPIGLTDVSVGFQCKRYTDKAVGREAIDAFRGATSGLHEQGYFFATSRFTAEAIEWQRRPGAVPIAQFDGEKIVDIMFAKGFGVAFRELRIVVGLAPVPTRTTTPSISISIPPLGRATARQRRVAGGLTVSGAGRAASTTAGTNVGNDAGGNVSGARRKRRRQPNNCCGDKAWLSPST